MIDESIPARHICGNLHNRARTGWNYRGAYVGDGLAGALWVDLVKDRTVTWNDEVRFGTALPTKRRVRWPRSAFMVGSFVSPWGGCPRRPIGFPPSVSSFQ